MIPYTCDQVWEMVTDHQEEEFLTLKGLPFTYTIKGGELFISRRSKSITKSTFDAAWKKIQDHPHEITGPKKLNVFGAPYLWAIFRALGLLGLRAKSEDKEEYIR